MKFFAHCINNIDQIKDIDLDTGIEIDIRDSLGNLVLGHDPLQNNYQDIEVFLKNLKGRSVIANIKSERLEFKFYELLSMFSPESEYFFLDSSLSMIAKYGKYYNFASRFSEFESIITSENLIKESLVKWIWVDTFNFMPINNENVKKFNELKAKKCLTSPDLLGREYDIDSYAKEIISLGIKFDAICCKKNNITKWKKLLN